MKNVTLIALLSIALYATSCNDSSSHNLGENEKIELNDGEKWNVNPEMIPFILDGEKALSQFNNGDFEDLAKQLKTKNAGLIKSCSMDGKSHDELHKWLYPHIQLLEALENAENEQKATEIMSELKKSFQTYHSYFQ